MKDKEKELEKRIQELEAQNEGMKKRIAELEAQKSAPSKSRQQAEAVAAILQKDGIITKEQLSQINPKYPSDGVYYFKNLLHGQCILVRGIGYMTPAAHSVWQAEQEKKAAAAKKTATSAPAASASKEGVQAATA